MSETKDVRVKLTVYHSASCNGRKLATIHGIDEAASALSPGEYQLVLAALEPAPKPAGGEPVAWDVLNQDGEVIVTYRDEKTANEHAFSNFNRVEGLLRHVRPLYAAPPAPAASLSGGEVEDWRDDPSSDERWNAGVDFGMNQLCIAIGVDPKDVNWDAATETLDGDVQSVIWNILCARFGEELPPVTSPEAPQASEVVRAADDRYPSVFYAHDRSNRISVGHYNTASGWSPHIHVETSLENKPGARWVQVSLTPDEAEQFALHILNKVSHARTALAKIGGGHDK